MGTITSKGTRRISFDNTFSLNPALAIQKSIEDSNVLDIESITAAYVSIIHPEINEKKITLAKLTNTLNQNKVIEEKDDELIFTDNSIKFQEDSGSDYWDRRIIFLRKEHRIINKILETEYEKTIEFTNKLANTPKLTPETIIKVKPCYEWRSKILQCYEDNPHQPLVCSPIVQAFTKCVTSCKFDD